MADEDPPTVVESVQVQRVLRVEGRLVTVAETSQSQSGYRGGNISRGRHELFLGVVVGVAVREVADDAEFERAFNVDPRHPNDKH